MDAADDHWSAVISASVMLRLKLQHIGLKGAIKLL